MEQNLEERLLSLENAPSEQAAKDISYELAWNLDCVEPEDELHEKIELDIIAGLVRYMSDKHRGVKRDSGNPYSIHLDSVAHLANDDFRACCAALVHDTVEEKVDPIAERYIYDRHLSYRLNVKFLKNSFGKWIGEKFDILNKGARLRKLAKNRKDEIEHLFREELDNQAKDIRRIFTDSLEKYDAGEITIKKYSEFCEQIVQVHDLHTRRTYFDYHDEGYRLIGCGDLETAMLAMKVKLDDRTDNCNTMDARPPVSATKRLLRKVLPAVRSEKLESIFYDKKAALHQRHFFNYAKNTIKLAAANMSNKVHHFLFEDVLYSYVERTVAAAKTQLMINRTLELINSTKDIKTSYELWKKHSGSTVRTKQELEQYIQKMYSWEMRKDFERLERLVVSHNYYHRKEKVKFIYFVDTDKVLDIIQKNKQDIRRHDVKSAYNRLLDYIYKRNPFFNSPEIASVYLGMLLKHQLDKFGYGPETKIDDIVATESIDMRPKLERSMNGAIDAASKLVKTSIEHYKLYHIRPAKVEYWQSDFYQYEQDTGGLEGLTGKKMRKRKRWDHNVAGFTASRIRGVRSKKPKSLRHPFQRANWFWQMMVYDRILHNYRKNLDNGNYIPLKGVESDKFNPWDMKKMMGY